MNIFEWSKHGSTTNSGNYRKLTSDLVISDFFSLLKLISLLLLVWTSSYINITQSVFFNHTPVNCLAVVKQTWFWHMWLVFRHVVPRQWFNQFHPLFSLLMTCWKGALPHQSIQKCKRKKKLLMGLWKRTRLNINHWFSAYIWSSWTSILNVNDHYHAVMWNYIFLVLMLCQEDTVKLPVLMF